MTSSLVYLILALRVYLSIVSIVTESCVFSVTGAVKNCFGDDNDSIVLTALQGLKGDKGITGEKGAKGEPGLPAVYTDNEATIAVGPRGLPGLPGPQVSGYT